MTSLKRVPLEVGVMKSALEPLSTEIAFELIRFNIIFLPHF